MFNVICIGSATIDNFLTIHQKLKSVTYGTKVLVKHLETHTGGGGSNSAVALAKLGLKAAYLGKLGDDNNAKIIEKELKKFNVKILNKNKSKLPTDEAFILNSEQEKDRIIYVHKGSSEDLKIKDLPKKLNTKWFYLATLVGKSFPILTHLSKYALKNNIKILFNPSTYLARQGLKKLKPILKNTNILILNKEEAQLLLNTKNNQINYLLKNLKLSISKKSKGLENLDTQMNKVSLTQPINSQSKQVKDIVVITNGHQKLHALYQNTIYSLQPPDVKVLHTAGAGDAFNSGFLTGIIKKYPLEEALKLGQVNASSVIQHFGTKNKLLTETEAKELIKKYKIRVIKHVLGKSKKLA